MENQITIREALTRADITIFWEQLHTYFKRDIFPDPEDEDREYFLSDTEYRTQYRSSTTGRRIDAATCFSAGTGRTSALPCR